MEKDQPIIRPTQAGISIINENPIGVLEKLGKYEFVYDYRVPSFWDKLVFSSTSMPLGQSLVPQSNLVKEGGSSANMIAPSGYWSGQYSPQPVRVNSEPQVGTFSKGNIVNVLRFDGNNAIIQNPNYVEPEPNAPKTLDFGFDLKKTKEFSIPKDYLRKVDNTLEPTLLTGINYGANMKPQPFFSTPVIKPITNTVLEENATYYLTKDFTYFKNTYCPANAKCMPPPPSTILAGSKVTGTLVRRVLDVKLNAFNLQNGILDDSNFVTLLVVSTPDGTQNIPLEYLTKDAPKNSGTVVPAKNDNKNILMIVGAFLVGYLLFNNDTPTT
jgi:hypothetical protein